MNVSFKKDVAIDRDKLRLKTYERPCSLEQLQEVGRSKADLTGFHAIDADILDSWEKARRLATSVSDQLLVHDGTEADWEPQENDVSVYHAKMDESSKLFGEFADGMAKGKKGATTYVNAVSDRGNKLTSYQSDDKYATAHEWHLEGDSLTALDGSALNGRISITEYRDLGYITYVEYSK